MTPEELAVKKAQAVADTLRALRECYPDRWESVWNALGFESAADLTMKALERSMNPPAGLGAIIGALAGAALGSRLLGSGRRASGERDRTLDRIETRLVNAGLMRPEQARIGARPACREAHIHGAACLVDSKVK